MQANSAQRWQCAGHAADMSSDSNFHRQPLPCIAQRALDLLATGVIVTDEGRSVVEMNQAAEAIVQIGDGLIIRNGQLCARRVFETAKIAKLIAGAAIERTAGPVAARMLVGRCNNRPPYAITVAPVVPDLAVEVQSLAMILVVDTERRSPRETELAEFFGLSPAESRLAAALLTGKKLSSIAVHFGIQITTLRTQLSSILKKVGAERQSELVRILSSTGMGFGILGVV